MTLYPWFDSVADKRVDVPQGWRKATERMWTHGKGRNLSFYLIDAQPFTKAAVEVSL